MTASIDRSQILLALLGFAFTLALCTSALGQTQASEKPVLPEHESSPNDVIPEPRRSIDLSCGNVTRRRTPATADRARLWQGLGLAEAPSCREIGAFDASRETTRSHELARLFPALEVELASEPYLIERYPTRERIPHVPSNQSILTAVDW